MKIGFLGFGEAASSIALGLSREGLKGARAFDPLLAVEGKRERVLAKVEQSGAVAVETPGAAVREADIVFAAVPANYAVSTAQSGAAELKSGAIYVDVTTASPREKEQMAALVEAEGAKFVDGAMLGPLLQYLHKVPMLLSGSGSRELKERMEPYGMNLTVVEGPAGVATSIKFLRSISAKGIACILFETLQAAQHFHVENVVVDSLLESYGAGFEKVVNGYVSGTCIHAERREHEMQNVEDMLREAGLPCQMVTATREKLAAIKQLDIPSRFSDSVPRNWRGVLEGWGLNDQ